ncbi:hypothetical protein [Anatilimnocola floriformis]|uniref:hypothetical protein n=1 Tax=Anatilimnocola floriformis TaxID=2948575 RepID=UPI0020C22EB4|nr:hypothetical protein [Anatilimnocola floriformis]
MDRREQPGSTRTWRVAIVLVLIVLPVVYLLGTGPIYWLQSNEYISVTTFRWYMRPLDEITAYSRWAHLALWWYWTLWGAPPPPGVNH